MILDIENDVFNYVAAALKAAHTGIVVTGEYEDKMAKFPAVTIVEADNRLVQEMRSSSGMENAASLMYEVNVYSNKVAGRKGEAKAIANTADEAFASLGFVRSFREQIPNLNDATIYRIVARYEGTVGLLNESLDGSNNEYLIYRPY